jgi:O-antigen/teichoic acid export membrane protein
VNAGTETLQEGRSPERLKRGALGGFLWLSAGNVGRAILKVIVLATLARLLTPRDFGLVAAAGVVLWFSMIFSSLGVGPALIQRRELEPKHISTAFASSVALGILIAGLIALFAPLIAAFFRMDGLTPILRGLAVAFPIAGVSVVAECLLQRRLQFGSIAGAELASYAVGYGVVGVSLAWLGFGVWALVGADVVKAVLKSAVLLWRVPHSKRLHFDTGAFRDLLRFGSGYTASSLSTYLALQGDSFIVARFIGAAALGVYGRAYELMLVPAQALGTVLDKILFPTLAQVQEQPERLRLAYRRCTALVALLVVPISAATIILAPELIAALLGPGWEAAVVPFQILAIAMYFRIGYMVGHSVANSTGAVNQAASRNILYAVLVVVGAFVGQHWGLAGVAAGVMSAVVANFAIVFQLGARITGLTWTEFLRVHLPAFALTAVLGVAIWLSATALRSSAAPALLVLLGAATAGACTSLLLVRLAPGWVLGEDGLWMAHTLYQNAPGPLRPLVRAALGLQV